MRPRYLEAGPSALLSGFGLVLLLVALTHHAAEIGAIGGLIGPATAFLLDGVPALGLVYAGYWLGDTELSVEDRWQVCAWRLVGGALFASIMGLSILVRAFEGRVIGEAIFPLLVAVEAGGIAGVVGGHQTARARLEARRAQAASEERRQRTQQLRAVLDGVEAAIWIRDPDSRFVLANQDFRDLFGIPEETELDGATPEEILPETVAAQFREDDRQVVETEAPIEVEETVETERGERTLLTRITPLFEGGELYATCGIASDITEQKEYERTIERQNERLEQFASVVSHDLRNPLNVAIGRLELVEEECDSDHVAVVDRALGRMESLIGDLLTLARGGETITDPEPIDLATEVERCWSTVETEDATLEVDVDWTINADQSRLRQALENLIRNAIEHAGSDVTVTVGELNDGFYVEDDGPGIPREQREEVFDAGYSTRTEGTGFGLNIVKQVIDAHGWAVYVTEGTDGGARFEIMTGPQAVVGAD